MLLLIAVAVLTAQLAKGDSYVYTFHKVAGTGRLENTQEALAINSGVDGPSSVWADSQGNVYITQPWSNIIRKISAGAIGTNTISTFAGVAQRFDAPETDSVGAAANAVYLDRPRGIWGGAANKLMVANTIGRGVQEIDLTTNSIARVSGGLGPGNTDGDASTATWWSPFAGFTAANGDHYVADLHGCVIRRISAGITTTILGTFRNCDNSVDRTNMDISTSVTIGKPYALWGDTAGNLYFPEINSGRIQRISSAGKLDTLISGLSAPSGVWVDSAGNLFYSEMDADSVSFQIAGTQTRIKIADNTDGLVNPKGICGDSNGNIYIPDSGAKCLYMLYRASSSKIVPTTDNSGGYTGSSTVTLAGGDWGFLPISDSTPQLASNVALTSTYFVWADTSSNLFFTSSNDHVVMKIDATNNVLSVVAGEVGVVRQYGNGATAKVPATEDLTSAGFYQPQGLWGDTAGGLYVADSGNWAVRYITPDRTQVNRIAGSSRNGVRSGLSPAVVLSGTATNVDLAGPTSVWGDGINIFIYDLNCIFKMTGGSMSVFAGAYGVAAYAFDTNPLNIRLKGGGKGFSGQVAGDGSGNIYFSDPKSGIVWRVDTNQPQASQASVVIGDVNSLSPNPYPSVNCVSTPDSPLCEHLNFPYGVWVDENDHIYYTSINDNTDGTPDRVIKMTSPGASTAEVIFNPTNNPYGLTSDNDNNIYVAYGYGIDTYKATGSVPARKRYLRGEQRRDNTFRSPFLLMHLARYFFAILSFFYYK